MPDPRSNLFSVKPCPPQHGGVSSALIANMATDRRNFFGGIGKVGDLQILNSVGAGKIGAGLRTLASVSNTIRQGSGALPTSIGKALGVGMDAGSRWVLSNVGIAPSVVDALRDFHPEVANQALGQAGAIFQQVKQGGFTLNSIPGVLQDLQNLERLGRNIYTPGSTEANALRERCEASPYAIDLVSRAPKFKFLFVVEFVFNEGYERLQELVFPFVIKNSSRPKVRYQMEDVNYYNFRSKVITRTEFDEMSMSFHDDTQNYGMRFYNAYMRAHTPITNIDVRTGLDNAENNGMNFDGDFMLSSKNPVEGIKTNYSTGSFGPLANGRPTVLREIRLMHIFDYGRLMNVYTFFNPRMTNLTLDDLDMSVGTEGSEFQCTFNYDSVYIATDLPMGVGQFSTAQEKANPMYPLRNTEVSTAGGSPLPGNLPFGSPISIPGVGTAIQAITTKLPAASEIPFISGGGIGGASGGVGGPLDGLNTAVGNAKNAASSIAGSIADTARSAVDGIFNGG